MRFDYEYERHGACSLLVAFAPRAGMRLQTTNESWLLPFHVARVGDVFAGEKDRLSAKQLELAHLGFVLREFVARRNLCVGLTLRDALHAEENIVAQPRRVVDVGSFAHLFIAAHQFDHRA